MLAFRSLLLFGAGASSADPEEVARAAEDKAQPLPHLAYICYIFIDLISYTYLTYIYICICIHLHLHLHLRSASSSTSRCCACSA